MTLPLMTEHAAVGIYADHEQAENALRMLAEAGITLDNISVIGGAERGREAASGKYRPPTFVKQELQKEGIRDGIWIGGMFGSLVGFGALLVPGVGPLMVLGPLAALLIGVGAGALVGDITGAVTFTEIAKVYRDWLVAGNFLVIVHCATSEEPLVRGILESAHALGVHGHPTPAPRTPPRTPPHAPAH